MCSMLAAAVFHLVLFQPLAHVKPMPKHCNLQLYSLIVRNETLVL